MKFRLLVRVWDDENYCLADAIVDGAVQEFRTILEAESEDELDVPQYLAVIRDSLRAAGKCTNNYADKLKFDWSVSYVQKFTVQAEVLEWNTYTIEVEAATQAEADALAIERGAVSFESLDVSYGTSDHKTGQDTSDRLVNY